MRKRTGIAPLLASVAVPQGSFYLFFASKEEFAGAVLEAYRDLRQTMFSDTTRSPLTRLMDCMSREPGQTACIGISMPVDSLSTDTTPGFVVLPCEPCWQLTKVAAREHRRGLRFPVAELLANADLPAGEMAGRSFNSPPGWGRWSQPMMQSRNITSQIDRGGTTMLSNIAR